MTTPTTPTTPTSPTPAATPTPGPAQAQAQAPAAAPAFLPLPAPFHQRGPVTLYCGDSLQILMALPPGSADALLADPPYSSGGAFRGDRMQTTRAKYAQQGAAHELGDFSGDSRDQRGYLAWSTLWLTAATHILTPGALVGVFADWRQLPVTTDALQAAGLVYRGIAVWLKNNGRPCLGRFASQAEYIPWGTNGPRDATAGNCPRGWCEAPASAEIGGAPPIADRVHLTQKPLPIMEWLCSPIAEGATILDPFAGSGTTLLAAIRTGHRALGVEIDPKNCEAIAQRIDAELDQKRLPFDL